MFRVWGLGFIGLSCFLTCGFSLEVIKIVEPFFVVLCLYARLPAHLLLM